MRAALIALLAAATAASQALASDAAATKPGAAKPAVAGAESLIGRPASELQRRRVKLVEAEAIATPDLPAIIARGGMRDIPPVTAPPVRAPGPGEPDLAYGALQRGFYLTALGFALPRAEAGDPAAQTLIAELYTTGRGVSRNLETAKAWYRLAAERGDADAQFAYASLLLSRAGRDAPRPREVRRYMERAAKGGHPQAQFNLAQMIVEDRPSFRGFELALPHYRAAAEQGLPDAQYVLATMLADGNGLAVPDPVEARRWMRRAADNGFDTAQLELGIWLVNGKGGKRDVAAGRAWLERAARDGNVVAQNRLARLHAFGVGTLIDPVKAGAWHILTKRRGFKDPEMDRRVSTYAEADLKAARDLARSWRTRQVVQRSAGPAPVPATRGGEAGAPRR